VLKVDNPDHETATVSFFVDGEMVRSFDAVPSARWYYRAHHRSNYGPREVHPAMILKRQVSGEVRFVWANAKMPFTPTEPL